MPNYLKVSTKTKKSKLSKVKSKTVEYFKKISIPGISQIVTTESYLIKILWTVVIICVFGVGFDNISEAVTDYYKFNKITNIERIYPENVTFSAITFCNPSGYNRRHYRNGSLIKSERVYTNLLKQFLNFQFTFFFLLENNDSLRINVSNHFDVFKINHPRGYSPDCLRFNAVTNKSVELFKASSILDGPRISFNHFYRKNTSPIEYYYYSFPSSYYVYVGDNSLDSVENLQYLMLRLGSQNEIEIEKVSIETKLPEPYNSCRKCSVDAPYHQMDCIEACTYKEIKNKYNCTFHSTLFSIQGFRQCMLNYMALKTNFSASCHKECPLESCFSEKFTFDYKTLSST
jgi:hypothetical protein